MPFLRILVTGLVLAVAGVLPAAASDKDFLQSQYDRMMAAIATKDANAYLAMLDPGIVSIDEKGKRQGFAEMKASYDAIVGKMRNFRAVVAVDDVQNTGTKVTATVKTAVVTEVSLDGNSSVVVVVVEASEDAWEIKGGGWKLTYTKTLTSQTRQVPANVLQQLNGGAAEQRAQPNQPQQQRPVQQPRVQQPSQAQQLNNQQVKKLMYDECMRHCAYSGLNCSMGTGNYFGGNHRVTGIPCLTTQTSCQVGCMPPR